MHLVDDVAPRELGRATAGSEPRDRGSAARAVVNEGRPQRRDGLCVCTSSGAGPGGLLFLTLAASTPSAGAGRHAQVEPGHRRYGNRGGAGVDVDCHTLLANREGEPTSMSALRAIVR